MATLVKVFGRLALVLVLASLVACADEAETDGSATEPNPNSDITVPETSCAEEPAMACGYDAACEGLAVETGTCEMARCVQGCCVAVQSPTFSACDAAGAGPCEVGTCSTSGACIVVTADDGQS